MSEQFDLAAEAKEFADDVSVRALTCLEGAPIPDELKVLGSPDRKRFTFNYRQTIHASPGGPPVGLFGMAYALTADRMGRHLAVHTSKLEVTDVRARSPSSEWSTFETRFPRRVRMCTFTPRAACSPIFWR